MAHDDHHHQHHDDHGHGHGHQHHHHHHHPAAGGTRLAAALAILAGFTLFEAGGGWWANSLALLSESVHMAADCASLALALLAHVVAARPGGERLSYGWRRGPALAAFVNGLALLALTAWVVVEALRRLLHPEPVHGVAMLVVAAVGALANVAVLLVLSGRASLNERSARAHVLGDLLGALAAAAAAGVVIVTGRGIADPLLSLLVSALILRSGWSITRDSAHVLLEGAPAGFDPAAVRGALAELPGVADVHHLHAWTLSGEQTLVTLHARLGPGADSDAVLRGINAALRERFGVEHATVQIESGCCADAAGCAGREAG